MSKFPKVTFVYDHDIVLFIFYVWINQKVRICVITKVEDIRILFKN